jgi:hypothetical protein
MRASVEHAGPRGAARVSVHLQKNLSGFCVAITDNGAGIDLRELVGVCARARNDGDPHAPTHVDRRSAPSRRWSVASCPSRGIGFTTRSLRGAEGRLASSVDLSVAAL